MKKCILLFAVFLLCGALAQAQREEGTRFVNTQLTGLDFGKFSIKPEGASETQDLTTLGLNLSAGQFIRENISLGVSLNYLNLDLDGGSEITMFSIGAGLRYYLESNLFGGGGLNLVSLTFKEGQDDTKTTPILFFLEGGYSYHITERIAIEPALNYAVKISGEIEGGGFGNGGDWDDWKSSTKTNGSSGMDYDLTRIGLTVGIIIYF